jgi:hypothetical protein
MTAFLALRKHDLNLYSTFFAFNKKWGLAVFALIQIPWV